jgi:hypothetical protein
MNCIKKQATILKTYYYASGVTLNNFKLNFDDPMYYDLLNAKAIAGNTLEFHISGLNEGRLTKTKEISDYELTYRNLNVCVRQAADTNISETDNKMKNCSKCYKCRRTMVGLDVLGKLDLYKNVFNLNVFKENKEKYLADVIYTKLRANNVFHKRFLNILN